MGKPVLDFCRAERVNIEADVFAVLAVAVASRARTWLTQRAIAAAERFIPWSNSGFWSSGGVTKAC